MEKPEGITRRKMVLIFIVDTSGSMYGTKIQAVNQAISEVLPELQKMSDSNADAVIQVAVLGFDNAAYWLTTEPQDVDKFIYNDLQSDGGTNLADALFKLNEKLSKDGYMGHATGAFAPALFLMSDGQPNDDEYKKELQKLKNNNWFKKAIKVACAIGDDADIDVLTEFTGTSETVLTVHTPENLKKLIRFVSVTSSQIGSQSAHAGGGQDTVESKQTSMISAIQANQAQFIDDNDVDEW